MWWVASIVLHVERVVYMSLAVWWVVSMALAVWCNGVPYSHFRILSATVRVRDDHCPCVIAHMCWAGLLCSNTQSLLIYRTIRIDVRVRVRWTQSCSRCCYWLFVGLVCCVGINEVYSYL